MVDLNLFFYFHYACDLKKKKASHCITEALKLVLEFINSLT